MSGTLVINEKDRLELGDINSQLGVSNQVSGDNDNFITINSIAKCNFLNYKKEFQVI